MTPQTANFSEATLTGLKILYNDAAEKLGEEPVSRFSDRHRAILRVTAILSRLRDKEAGVVSTAGLDEKADEEAVPAFLKKGKPVEEPAVEKLPKVRAKKAAPEPEKAAEPEVVREEPVAEEPKKEEPKPVEPKSAQKHANRETWLQAATALLDKEFFSGRGYTLPTKLRSSVGIPAGKKTAIGQCWDPVVSKDGTTEMFICPSLDNPVEVLATLLHEMIHAELGIKEGHGKAFRKRIKEFGLAGKATATFAEEGSELRKTLEVISGRLGTFPHTAMEKRVGKRAKGELKPDSWRRYGSPQEPKFKVRISPKSIAEFGVPLDPWGNEMEPLD